MFDDDENWLGNLFLGHEGRQTRDIRRLKEQAASVDSSVSHLTATLQRKVARLELVCETLMHLVLAKRLVDQEELKLLMAQVDLRDGREDGALTGDEAPTSAPKCANCGLPVNTRREACVYCDAAVERPARRKEARARMVTCTRCQAQVEERRSVFTEHGVVCEGCHAAE